MYDKLWSPSEIKGDFKCYIEITSGKDIIRRIGGKNWLGRGKCCRYRTEENKITHLRLVGFTAFNRP